MPSREEIVEWLKEAARSFNGQEMARYGFGDFLKEKAAQVEAMRCDTCRHYDGDYQLCEVIGGSELLIPVYFGCFHHEQKPAG